MKKILFAALSFVFLSTNAQTAVLSAADIKRDIQGQEMEVENFASDVKQFGDLRFPMIRTQKIQGQVLQEIKMTSLELNVTIDEKVFDK